MLNSRTNPRGFTLLEIMVALAIFAIASVTFYFQTVSILKSISRIEEKYIAEIVAENSLEEYFISRNWPSIGEEENEVDMYGRMWYVTIRVADGEMKDTREIDAYVYSSDDKKSDPLIGMRRIIGKNK